MSLTPEDRLGVKVQSFNKERTRAMLVCYLQHTDVYSRLEEVDPDWAAQVTGEERAGDAVFTRVRLTLRGVSRENVGEGNDPKSSTSDALKRAAMLFGVGRYLYDSETVWAEYDDKKDRFKAWTVAEFNALAKRKGVAETPTEESEKKKKDRVDTAKRAAVAAAAKASPKPVGERSREDLNRILMNLYRPYLLSYPATDFSNLLVSMYDVHETRLMTLEQLEHLVNYMEKRIADAGGKIPPLSNSRAEREPGQEG